LARSTGLGAANLSHQIIKTAGTRIGRTVAHHGHNVSGDDKLAIRKRSGAATIDGSRDQVVEAAAGTHSNLAAARQWNEAALRKPD
jgi:hypothetical protein